MKIADLKKKVKELIAKDLIKAFDFLSEAIQSDSANYDEVIYIQGKWQHLNKDFDRGLISRNEFSIELSKILNALIQLTNALEETDLEQEEIEGTFESTTHKSKGAELQLFIEDNQGLKLLDITVFEQDKVLKVLDAYFEQHLNTYFEDEFNKAFYLPILKRTNQLVFSTHSFKTEGIQSGDTFIIQGYNIEELRKSGAYKSGDLQEYYNIFEIIQLCRFSTKVFLRVFKETDQLLPLSLEILFKVRSITGINPDFSPKIAMQHVLLKKDRSWRFISDVWHPNIKYVGKDKGQISILSDLQGFQDKEFRLYGFLIYVGKLLQFKLYQSEDILPYPTNPEAARWIKEYAEPNELINKDRRIYFDYSFLLA